MKSILLTIAIAMLSFQANATVDAFTTAWIVVEDFNEGNDYMLKNVNLIGCYGVEQGPQLVQFTSPYVITSSLGCGVSMEYKTDLNALSCAELIQSEESDDFRSFKKIVLDISKCTAKDNAKFITYVRTAAARNFPQTKNGKIVKNKEVELVLIK